MTTLKDALVYRSPSSAGVFNVDVNMGAENERGSSTMFGSGNNAKKKMVAVLPPASAVAEPEVSPSASIMSDDRAGESSSSRVSTCQHLSNIHLSHPIIHLGFNITSAIGIVFINKLVFVYADFPFPVTLTLLHITMTAIGMRVFERARFFEAVKLNKLAILPIAAMYVGYVIFGNLSIQVNSIGFYQISKVLGTPNVMLLERIFYQKKTSFDVKCAVLVMSVGIGLATVTDASVQLFGFVIALTAVFVSSSYSILIGVKQKELEVGSMQLLHQFSPVAAGMLLCLLPMIEPIFPLMRDIREDATVWGWIKHKATLPACLIILLSSCMGLLLNWSMFLIIGSTSPLTFNVVGHLKTVLVIIGGIVFFGDTMPPKKALSLLVAAAGIGWYSYLKQSQLMGNATPAGAGKGSGSSPQKSGVKQEDDDDLPQALRKV